MSYTCSRTGETSDGKHYVLRSTEGDEIVSPGSLFGAGLDDENAKLVRDLQERVEQLEAAVIGSGVVEVPPADDGGEVSGP